MWMHDKNIDYTMSMFDSIEVIVSMRKGIGTNKESALYFLDEVLASRVALWSMPPAEAEYDKRNAYAIFEMLWGE